MTIFNVFEKLLILLVLPANLKEKTLLCSEMEAFRLIYMFSKN